MSIPIYRSTILGLVLAGGQSRRMGLDKAFALLGGHPMLSVVVERMRAQVGDVVVSAGVEPARLAQFDYACVPDPAGFAGMGPAAGVLAGLRHARERGFRLVATAPCDAPFAPSDWVARLAEGLSPVADVSVAQSARGVEAAFAIWRVDTVRAIESALEEGERSLRRIAQRVRAAEVRFEPAGDVDPFWNLNQPSDLALANEWLARQTRDPGGRAR